MQMFWPEELKRCFDIKGGSFGDKSLFLEFVGLLLPFLAVPKSLANQHVVLKVDNIGCYFAWENKNVSKDPHASVLVRALVLISSYLSCYVHCLECWLGMPSYVTGCQGTGQLCSRTDNC